MQRSRSLRFIPQSINFSELEEWQVEHIAEDKEVREELDLLNLMYQLPNDKMRCILLIELLRQLGYNFDYTSAAKSLHIQWRWFMRVKQSMNKKLKEIIGHTAEMD
jgi:hypothetical protein